MQTTTLTASTFKDAVVLADVVGLLSTNAKNVKISAADPVCNGTRLAGIYGLSKDSAGWHAKLSGRAVSFDGKAALFYVEFDS